MILLLIRLAIFIVLIGCILLIPYSLFWLNESDKKKQRMKRELEVDDLNSFTRNKQTIAKKTVSNATPEDEVMDNEFTFIKRRHHMLIKEKEWLSIESAHGLTDTFVLDLERYKTLYSQLKDKSSVEESVSHSIHVLKERLDAFEKEIEEAKKVALHRQGYIIEKRKEKH